MPRRLPGDRQVLIRVWTVSLCGAAVLLVALAWVAAGDPNLAGRAQAVADAQALLGAMEVRGDGWLRSVRARAGDPLGSGSGADSEGAALAEARLASFRLEDGRVVEPLPLPEGREVSDPASPQLTPAQGWLRQGMQRMGNPQAALADFERGIEALQGTERATSARLHLQAALAAQRLDRGEEALRYLERLTPSPQDQLDGASLWMVVGYRRADQLQALGRSEEAEQVRDSMRAMLLLGQVAVPPEDLLLDAELLAGEGGLAEQDRARLTAMARATRVDQALRATPRASLLRTEVGTAVVSTDRTAATLYGTGALESALLEAWSALLPAGGSFALAPPEAGTEAGRESGGGELVGVPVAPEGMRVDLGLWVRDFRPFVAAQTRRQGLLLAAAAIVAAALVTLAWFGRRLLLRQAELERVRAEFLAGVSHELRTPAASLVLLAENLADGRVRDEARRGEYYEALRRDAQRLQRLVGDVLDVSRLERGAFEVQPLPVAPGPLVRRLAEDQRARLRDAGLELHLEIEEDLPEVALDASAVERGLANLLENARTYASGGLRVTVRARLADRPAAPDGSDSGLDGRALLVEVEDDGPGVPSEWRERVFERYQRAPSAETLGAGAGLGLTLVRETAEAHGGSVTLAESADGGAHFTLRLPLSEGPVGGPIARDPEDQE